jgi:predicted metalloprotease with PDZ domain
MSRLPQTIAIAMLGALAPTITQAQDNRAEERPGWLGIRCNITIVDDNGRRTVTVGIGDVLPGSPADRSGLKRGDRILRIDGKPIETDNCSGVARALRAGDTVRMALRGADGTRDLTIIAAPRPPGTLAYGGGMFGPDGEQVRRAMRLLIDSARIHFEPGDSLFTYQFPNVRFHAQLDTLWKGRMFHFDTAGVFFNLPDRWNDMGVDLPRLAVAGRNSIAGAQFTEIDSGLADVLGTSHGLLVTKVPDGTPAARAGLESGDVIARVNGRTINSIEDLRRMVLNQTIQPLKLEVVRKGRTRTLELDGRPAPRRR